MRRVGIVDYGLCNIDFIRRATEVCGGQPTVIRNPDDLATQDLLILPGVGAFGAAMANLDAWGLATALQERVATGMPLLGICLGMQLLANSSAEGGAFRGLGLVPGDVVQLETIEPGERVPHMGWNEAEFVRPDPISRNIPRGTDFYFVHSFHLRCADECGRACPHTVLRQLRVGRAPRAGVGHAVSS